MSTMRVIPRWAGAVWGWLVVGFVVTPFLAVICVSLSDAAFISFPWDQGFSLDSYRAIPEEQEFITAALNSFRLALYTAIAAVLTGTCAAVAVTRYSFPGRSLVVLAGSSPLFVPQVMTGLAVMLALSATGLGGGLVALLVGHIAITVPFVLRVTMAALAGFDLDQELAAQNLGASKLRAFLVVTLPQVRSGIAAGAVMAAIVSFDNVALSIFLAGPGFPILPVFLYIYSTNNFDGVAAAVSVSMIVLSLAAAFALDRLVGLDKLFGGDVKGG